MGRFDLALDCFRQVLATSRSGGSRYLETLALINLGQAHTGLGHGSEALACSRRAVEIARETGYQQAERTALRDIARTYRSMRDPGKAWTWYRRARTACQQAGDRHGEAEILRDLGDLSDAAGRHEAACRSWRQALAIADDLGDVEAAGAIRGRLEQFP